MRRVVLFSLLFYTLTQNAIADAQVLNKILAVVEDSVITYGDLQERLKELSPTVQKEISINPHLKEALAKEILEDLIHDRLAEKRIKELGIKVTDEELEAAISRIIESNNMTEDQFLKKLKESDQTLEDFKKKIRFELEKEKLINIEVRSKIVITESAIKDYFEKNKDEFGGGSDQVRIACIFLPFKEGRAEEALEFAKELKAKIQKGADFHQLAKEYSMGPGREAGGDLGNFRQEDLHPDIRRLVAGMKKGDVSDPYILGNTVQLLRLIETEGGNPRSYEEVKEVIRDILYRQELERRFKEWVVQMQSRYYVRLYE